MSPETMVHLFWQCPYTNKFWKDVSRYIIDNIDLGFSLCSKNVLFGFPDDNNNKAKQLYPINLIIIIAKFHIYKAKYSQSKPLFLIFDNEAKQYINSISDSKNKKASKTIELSKFVH